MIDRYSLPEATALWTDEAKYNAWLKVELAACRAMVKHKIMPEAMYKRLASKANNEFKSSLSFPLGRSKLAILCRLFRRCESMAWFVAIVYSQGRTLRPGSNC